MEIDGSVVAQFHGQRRVHRILCQANITEERRQIVCSNKKEESGITNPDAIGVLQQTLYDNLAVDQRSTRAAEIPHLEGIAALDKHAMPARNRAILDRERSCAALAY